MILIESGRINILRILIVYLFLIAGLSGQDSLLNYDSTIRNVIEIDSVDLANYHSDERFNYSRELQDELTLLDLFWIWLKSLFPEQVNAVERSFGQILVYSLMAIGLVLIIMQVSGFRIQSLFKADKQIPENMVRFADDIETVNIDHLISEFEAAANYHEALRYRFLSLLKWLDSKRLIKWKIDKTNYEYLIELKYSQLFKEIIYQFERVCYGDFAIDLNSYQTQCERHNQFKSGLGQK